ITQIARIRSSWKVIQFTLACAPTVALMEGLIGQYGIDELVVYAAHSIAAHNPSWHQPSAIRAFMLRASAEPRLLPIPRPTRKTARINENVYVVAPKSSESWRVHTTSDPSAVR